MKYKNYFHEVPESNLASELSQYNNSRQKKNIRQSFIESQLAGITDDDFSVIPRVLPASYLPTLKKSAYLLTKFTMRLLSLPEKEIRAILPRGPVCDHLLNELEVLRYRRGRITGSFRFDMAIVGPPDRHHPPVVLEINEIGFDGLARSTMFQKTLLQQMPSLRGRLRSLDTAAAEVRNMRRLGEKIARIQYDSYNWDEEYLLQTAKKMKVDVRLVSPKTFGLEIDHDTYPHLIHEIMRVQKNRVVIGKDWKPDAINMSFAYGIKDYQEGHSLYRQLVQAKTPQYGSFLTGLVASKTILLLLDDPGLRKRLLGNSKYLSNSILPAHLLSDANSSQLLKHPDKWVIKHTDGCGGEQVFMNEELERKIKRIPKNQRHEWVLQKKTKLNLIDVNGLLSRQKQAISDLGVFVQYDWAKDRFQHFEVGGLMTRATNNGLKVNVSGGGLQVAVLIDRLT